MTKRKPYYQYTFHNITVQLEAQSAREAYRVLEEQMKFVTSDWRSDTYSSNETDSTEERDCAGLI